MSHLKDLFVWINESEHFKLGVVQKDGNLKSVFQRLMLNVENIWNYFKWVQDEDNLGKVHRQNQWAQRVPGSTSTKGRFFSESMMHFSHCPKNVPKTIVKKRF